LPIKDPIQRKQYNRGYGREYARTRVSSKQEGLCSVPTCSNKTDGTHKKCEHHLAYMRQYKADRAVEKRLGQCSRRDCSNDARPDGKLCERCLDQAKAEGKKPSVRARVTRRNQRVQEEVLRAYGGKCACCGETEVAFLSIDHIDGWSGEGPRKGSALYCWLKRNGFPAGYRVLCMTCNFTLGHHGYCPHGTLTQVCRAGRPALYPVDSELKWAKRAYFQHLKLEALNAYGGPSCVCCGEDHIECLQLDHIDGNGAEHRREEPKAKNLYVWLRQRGWPPGYRVLCVNCNFAVGHFGVCPHQDRLEAPWIT